MISGMDPVNTSAQAWIRPVAVQISEGGGAKLRREVRALDVEAEEGLDH
jgi:hypothetical protein